MCHNSCKLTKSRDKKSPNIILLKTTKNDPYKQMEDHVGKKESDTSLFQNCDLFNVHMNFANMKLLSLNNSMVERIY